MANPTYGDTYDPSYPTFPLSGLALDVGDPLESGDLTLEIVIPYGGSQQMRFVTSDANMRMAYQVRMRLSCNAVGWDGGTTWTDWEDGNGNVGAWEELYTGTGATASSAISGTTYRATTWYQNLSYSTATYDAIEVRVQCWSYWYGGGVGKYGSPTDKIIRIDYSPTFAATAIASTALQAIEVDLSIDTWGRGASVYKLHRLESGTWMWSGDKSSANGEFVITGFNFDIASTSVTIVAEVWPVDAGSAFYPKRYSVTTPITKVEPDHAVTKPVVTIDTSDDVLDFTVNDASYERVIVLATWSGGSKEVLATKSGGNWYASVLTPFGVPVTWRVSAYKTILGQLLFNSTDSGSPVTIAGYGYELRAADGRSVTLTLEAKEQMTWDVDSATITLASGRTVARHGLGNKRTWTLRGQLLGSSHSATSDWIDALAILNLPQNLTYRNPYGEVARVCVTSWTRNPASIWDVLDISVSFTEVE